MADAPYLQYNSEHKLAGNDGGFGLIVEMRRMSALVESIQKEHESDSKESELRFKQLEHHRQSHLDLRNRAISTWVRDALKKDTLSRKQEIHRLNKDVIYGGDIRSDAIVITERYKKSSTEWQSFSMLYGLTLDDMDNLDQEKCPKSLVALNQAASILLDNALTSLPTEAMEKEHEDLVALRLKERYEEAEEMSSTLWE